MFSKEDIYNIIYPYIDTNKSLTTLFLEYISKTCSKANDQIECIYYNVNLINSLNDFEQFTLQETDDSGINFNTQLQYKNKYSQNLLSYNYIPQDLFNFLSLIEQLFEKNKDKFNNDSEINKLIKNGLIYANEKKFKSLYNDLRQKYNNQELYNIYYDICQYNNWNI